uniref:cartilage matrix protein-like isoform X1 n=1 Tax=Myxine glutinosa TaxID=7769 RepID=UPI00358F28DE
MARWTFFCFTLLVNCLLLSSASAQEPSAPITSEISGLPLQQKFCEYEKPADVVFLIDGSSSITEEIFNTTLFLVRTIVNGLDIDSGNARAALVQYSGSFMEEKNTLHFDLDWYNSNADLQKAISSVPYMTGFTQTGFALFYTLDSIFRSHARPYVEKILIFISDGGGYGNFEAAADEMKASGVTVFSIGVGDINFKTLQVIASDPDTEHAIQFNQLPDIQEIISTLSLFLCNTMMETPIPITKPAPTETTTIPLPASEPPSPPQTVPPTTPEPVSLAQVPAISPAVTETTTIPPPTTEPPSPPQTVPPTTPEPVSLAQVPAISPAVTEATTIPLPTTEPPSPPQTVPPTTPEPATLAQVITIAPAVSVCEAKQKVDLVFLLDGSSSVTITNFKKVLNAVQMIVDSLDIGADSVRAALVQYSGSLFGGKNTLHFNLDQYSNHADLQKSISSVSYMTGFTYTGNALDYTLRNVFEAKARPSVPKVLILITDGNASDSVTIPAKNVKDFGVTVYSIGVGNVNTDQLEDIASDPDSTHVFAVKDFADLQKILQELGSSVCKSAQGIEVSQ